MRDLDISGRDLIEQGYEGKAIGDRLQHLLNAVLDEKVDNRKESLLAYLNKDQEFENEEREDQESRK